MRKAWCALFLIGMACTTDDSLTQSMIGEWEIAWNLDKMTTLGLIEFNEDGHAEVLTTSVQNDLLSPGSHHATFHWELTSDMLTLERSDNQLELSYKIVNITNDLIELSYVDEIQITLLRLR